MTDQKKPEAIADDDLDAVQGAGARAPAGKDGIIWIEVDLSAKADAKAGPKDGEQIIWMEVDYS